MLADLPFQLFFSFLFIALPYYPIGFHPDVDRFFTCVAILVMVSTVAASFGKRIRNVIIRFFFKKPVYFSYHRLLCFVLGILPQDIFSAISTTYHSFDVVWRFLLKQRIRTYLLHLAEIHLLAHVRKQRSNHQSMAGRCFRFSILQWNDCCTWPNMSRRRCPGSS